LFAAERAISAQEQHQFPGAGQCSLSFHSIISTELSDDSPFNPFDWIRQEGAPMVASNPWSRRETMRGEIRMKRLFE
jgi:hypothetical protein